MPYTFLSANSADVFVAGFCGLGLIFYFLFIVFCSLLSTFLMVLKILMIIDCARKRFESSTEQAIWLIVNLIVPFGAVIYCFVVKYPDSESPGLCPRPSSL
ncbi:PLDc N-terminal domain-containing protein [bacterium]|nr:PLDc N-terminal domain-containing protein [bacterium]